MTSPFLWQVIGPYCFKTFIFIVSRCWLKRILPHILIKPFFNSYSEGIKARETKWLLTGTEVQSIQPDSFIMLLYNPNGILITHYRANKTASMLLSGYKCNNTNYCYSCLRKGCGFFWCPCLQFTTYKYEIKVCPLNNVLIIPFYLLRTPKKLKLWNLGFLWFIVFFLSSVFLFLFLNYVQSCLYAQSRQMPGTVNCWGQQNEDSTAAHCLCQSAGLKGASPSQRHRVPQRSSACIGKRAAQELEVWISSSLHPSTPYYQFLPLSVTAQLSPLCSRTANSRSSSTTEQLRGGPR